MHTTQFNFTFTLGADHRQIFEIYGGWLTCGEVNFVLRERYVHSLDVH